MLRSYDDIGRSPLPVALPHLDHGAKDFLGAAQSGRRSGLKMLSLLRDEDVIAEARIEAQDVVEADPDLARHPGLAGLVAGLLDEERAEYLEKA